MDSHLVFAGITVSFAEEAALRPMHLGQLVTVYVVRSVDPGFAGGALTTCAASCVRALFVIKAASRCQVFTFLADSCDVNRRGLRLEHLCCSRRLCNLIFKFFQIIN